MKKVVLFFALAVGLLASASTMQAQVNTSRYVTLTVKSGKEIKFKVQVADNYTPIRIECGGVQQNHSIVDNAPNWSSEITYNSYSGTTMTIYGDIIGLNCYNNGDNLTAIDLSHNTELTELDCAYNNLTTLDVSNNTKLTKLDCSGNNFTGLDLSKNTQLKTLWCLNSKLNSLDLSKNTQLERLYCYGTNFSTQALDDIYCSLPIRQASDNAKICPIYQSTFPNHAAVIASNAQNAIAKNWKVQYAQNNSDISTTGTYTCPELNTDSYITLAVKNGEAIELDFWATANVTPIRIVSGSKTENIIVSGTRWEGKKHFTTGGTNMTIYGDLKRFECAGNGANITALDVSNSPGLETLLCQGNQISRLGVSSNNTNLSGLVCHGNNLTTSALDHIYCSLPDRTGKYSGVIEPVYNSSSSNHATVLATNKTNAIAKNWKVQYSNGNANIPATTGSYTCPQLNMSRYITLTVKSGKVISLDFRAAAEYTPVRIVSGSNTEDLTVGTSWYGGSNQSNYFFTSDGTTITIYGDITDFDCRDNEENITAIDISRNTLLKWLICLNNHISKLDLSKNTELSLLNCKDNKLSSLDISKNTKLTTLYCPGNNLSTQALDDIYCALPVRHASDSALIEPVYNSSSPDIATVLATNKQNAIDKNWKVQYYADDTDIPATTGTYTCPQLNMSRYITLTVAKDSAIKLDFMAAAAGTPIRIVSGSNTQDITVGASSWTGIKYYTADGTTMTVYGDLTGFDCHNNGENVTALDASNNTQLTALYCNKNNLSSLDLSKNTQLQALGCIINQLSSLDLSKNTKLSWLYCGSNKLTILDVSKNTQLMELRCFDNKLSSLDISKNTKLYKLECHGNNFSTQALDDIYCALPDRTGKDNGAILPIFNSSSSDLATVLATNKQNAIAKNWKVQYYDKTDIPATTGKHKCSATDIAEATAEQALTLYPNPVADVLYLSATARTIRVYDMYGTEVAHAADTDRVEVSHLPAGIYTVRADGTVAKMVKR